MITRKDFIIIILIYLVGILSGGWIVYAVKKCPCDNFQPINIPHENARIDSASNDQFRHMADSILSN